jgi:hypothetical protein
MAMSSPVCGVRLGTGARLADFDLPLVSSERGQQLVGGVHKGLVAVAQSGGQVAGRGYAYDRGPRCSAATAQPQSQPVRFERCPSTVQIGSVPLGTGPVSCDVEARANPHHTE